MAVSLFSISKNYLKNSLIDKASTFLDEDIDDVKPVINAVLVVLYSKIIAISETKKDAEKTYRLITSSHFSNLGYINLDDLFSGENSLLIDESNSFLETLFKGETEIFYNLIYNNYDIHKESVTALTTMILPVVIGSINKALRNELLKSSDFHQFIKEQKKYLSSINIPKKITEELVKEFKFYFFTKNRHTKGKNIFSRKPNPALKTVASVLIGFLVLGSAYFTTGTAFEKSKKRKVKDIKAIKQNTLHNLDYLYYPTEEVLGKYIEKYEFLGRFIEKELPNKTKLIVPANGAEAGIVNFIKSDVSTSENRWFPLRRVTASKGTNLVNEKSKSQINNLISILKAYPNVHIIVGGYSYNQNDPIKNFEVSYRFAEEVTKEILESSINENRITFKGYGNAHQLEKGILEHKRAGIKISKK